MRGRASQKPLLQARDAERRPKNQRSSHIGSVQGCC